MEKETEMVAPETPPAKLETRELHVYYGDKHVIKNVSLTIPDRQVTAFIGPSGCGKSTILRMFNRMNDYIDGFRHLGAVCLNGEEIYRRSVQVEMLRRKVGMVFQKPNPFPKSIFDNVAFGLRIQGVNDRKVLQASVEQALHQAALWEEVKDDLDKNALALSGGQQQRLCIARALAVRPEVILMDEPASALDPISTSKIEKLILALKKDLTVVIVTHNMQQAARISDRTAFFFLGELIEYGPTADIFTHPREKLTEDYISGRFG